MPISCPVLGLMILTPLCPRLNTKPDQINSGKNSPELHLPFWDSFSFKAAALCNGGRNGPPEFHYVIEHNTIAEAAISRESVILHRSGWLIFELQQNDRSVVLSQ
ncbi:hypothetical protein EVAR_4014_1 [Eumeta japonica]|uniref:Uncharacterized protein n=1 Tax=Eumeta variegata TaxID=151549 RepID=A0A4C1T6M9_EUMVA|nr:hypothetical protein EVAR_4014_1 [Eumeta japonica]